MESFMKPPPEVNFSTNDQLTLCERWRRWKETMKLYIGLNMSKSNEKEQCAAFRYVIGQEGRAFIIQWILKTQKSIKSTCCSQSLMNIVNPGRILSWSDTNSILECSEATKQPINM